MVWATYILMNSVRLFIRALSFAMFARMIVSFLPIDEESPIELFLYSVTEPLIVPVRMIVERSETLASFPLDISFYITAVLLSILTDVLP